MTPAHPTDKKARGNYARLICLNCRRRKIRCVLPENVSIEASERPRPRESSCQRCRQMELECIVDKTNLGRPSAAKRMIDGSIKDGSPRTSLVDFGCGESATSNDGHQADSDEDLGEYFYYCDQDGKLVMEDRYEALCAPIGLFCALAGREPTFASQHGAKLNSSAKDTQILSFLRKKGHRESIDDILYWHRVFYPDIPSITDLFEEFKGPAQMRMTVSPVYVLLLVLLSMATDQPSGKVQALEGIKPFVEARLVNQFEMLLLNMPCHRYTVLAIELVREYRPLTTLVSASNSARTLKGHNLLVIANNLIGQMIKERADDMSSVDGLLQRCRLDIAHTETQYSFQSRGGAVFRQHEHPTTALRLLESRLREQERVAPNVLLSLHIFLAAEARWRNMVELCRNWKSRAKIKDVILQQSATTRDIRDRFATVLESVQNASLRRKEFSNMRLILEAETHLYGVSVAGNGLGLAVVASSLHEAQDIDSLNWDEAEVHDAGRRILDSLTKTRPDDPDRSAICTFLQDVGKTRISELQKVMTNFIKLSETVDGNGMLFQGPTRSLCANLLYNCKDLAENYAAVFKGWKTVLGDVDTHEFLLLNCAKGLLALEAGAREPGAVARGSLVALTAKLVSSLRRIILGWKEKAAEAERASRGTLAVTANAIGSGNVPVGTAPTANGGDEPCKEYLAAPPVAAAVAVAAPADVPPRTPVTMVNDLADGMADADMLPIPSEDDLLANWDIWPQLELDELNRYLLDTLDDYTPY